MADESHSASNRQRKRGAARFSVFHIAQMVLSTSLLIIASLVMVGGGYLLGGAFLVAGTVLGLISVESD